MSKEFIPPTPEELDPFFPAFKVTEFIAQGGMGAVFKATQISLDRTVAIKILPYQMGLDPIFKESFETEAKAMARLNHPNLVGIHDFGNIHGMLYIVMEFVPGRSLYKSARGRRVEMEDACRLITAMCRGLRHAHNAGVIHRDIKPANVLIDDEANPKIVDFGLARPLDNTHTGGRVYGTKGYTAPEVLSDPSNIDVRADIFSLGAMLYELLTGRTPPYPYVSASSISDSHPDFDIIILKALHPIRDLRYTQVSEMADELEVLSAKLRAEKATLSNPFAYLTQRVKAHSAMREVEVKKPTLLPISFTLSLIGIIVGLLLLITNQEEKPPFKKEAAVEAQQIRIAQLEKQVSRLKQQVKEAKQGREWSDHQQEISTNYQDQSHKKRLAENQQVDDSANE